MEDKSPEGAPLGPKPTLALSTSMKEKLGEQLTGMGFTIVDIVYDEETGEPKIAGDEDVDCLYWSSDIFKRPTSQLNPDEKERRKIVGREVILPRIKKWVHVPSAGLNHWVSIFSKTKLKTSKQTGEDVEGITLTHSAGVYGLPMGEYCVAHVLSIAKRIPFHIELQKEHKWKRVDQKSLNNQVLGILGCGGIGLHTARLIRAFGIRILGTKRSIKEHVLSEDAPADVLSENERSFVDEWYPGNDESAMLEVFQRSDFVVCCLPLTPQTTECITTTHFEALGEDGWLINVARGEVIDQDKVRKMEHNTLSF